MLLAKFGLSFGLLLPFPLSDLLLGGSFPHRYSLKDKVELALLYVLLSVDELGKFTGKQSLIAIGDCLGTAHISTALEVELQGPLAQLVVVLGRRIAEQLVHGTSSLKYDLPRVQEEDRNFVS